MAFQQFRTDANLTQPIWMGELLAAHTLLPGGAKLVASAFPRKDAQTLTLVAGAVTAGAGKTLTLTAPLMYPIPAGWTLDFGSSELFTLSADAKAGAIALVGTLAADVEGGETASFVGTMARTVASGTLIGRTYAERDAGTGFGPYASADDEVYLLAFQVDNADIDNDATLTRHATLVKETWLPGWANYSTDAKAALRKAYQTVRG